MVASYRNRESHAGAGETMTPKTLTRMAQSAVSIPPASSRGRGRAERLRRPRRAASSLTAMRIASKLTQKKDTLREGAPVDASGTFLVVRTRLAVRIPADSPNASGTYRKRSPRTRGPP